MTRRYITICLCLILLAVMTAFIQDVINANTRKHQKNPNFNTIFVYTWKGNHSREQFPFSYYIPKSLLREIFFVGFIFWPILGMCLISFTIYP